MSTVESHTHEWLFKEFHTLDFCSMSNLWQKAALGKKSATNSPSSQVALSTPGNTSDSPLPSRTTPVP